MAGRASIARENGKKGGRPKGSRSAHTLEKEVAREAVRAQITARLGPLVDAQIDSAIGIKHFFLRDAAGQWQRIKNAKLIVEALNKGAGYWIYTKDPNSQAAREMLDRAIDRPKEQLQELAISGGPELIAKLLEGRQRAAKAKS